MSHITAPISLETLKKFTFDRTLNEDPMTHTLTILGTLPIHEEIVQAIIRIERTAIQSDRAPRLFGEDGLIKRVKLEENTDIVLAH